MRSRHSRSSTTCPSRSSLTLPTLATLRTPAKTHRGHHCTSQLRPEEAFGGPRLASLAGCGNTPIPVELGSSGRVGQADTVEPDFWEVAWMRGRRAL